VKHYTLIAALLLLACFAQAQPLSFGQPTVTGSACYNNGTMLINPTGGTGPYQIVISSGPNIPGVSYPIFPDSTGYFVSLHSGTYTVTVTDANGATVQQQVTIPGNYQFPQLTTTVIIDTIRVNPSLGRPPYLYSISTTGTNGPFSTPQSSPYFGPYCNGTYYLRVTDSCGNFFTSLPVVINQSPVTTNAFCNTQGGSQDITVAVPNSTYGHPPFRHILVNGSYTANSTTGQFTLPSQYGCPSTIYTIDNCGDTAVTTVDCNPLSIGGLSCSSFSTGNININTDGGTAPFTYQVYAVDSNGTRTLIATQSNGNFTNLNLPTGPGASIDVIVTDACGRTATLTDSYLDFDGSSDCPFNGKLYLNIKGGATPPVTAVCLNCNPQQTITSPPYVFEGLTPGTYTIRVTDSCGEVRQKDIPVPTPLPITGQVEFISCNDVIVTAYSTDGQLIDSGVTFTLLLNGTTPIDSNTTGIFNNLPTGVYNVNLHYDLCLDGSVSFYIPRMNGFCTLPYFDTSCELKMVVRYSTPDLPETYSLIDSNGVKYNEAPMGGGNGIWFNVSPGRYTLESDSGCAVNQEFGLTKQFTSRQVTNCVNKGELRLHLQYSNSAGCTNPRPFRYVLRDENNNLIAPTNFIGDTANYTNLDTGIYIAWVYFKDSIVVFNGDTIDNGNNNCFLDSMHIFLGPHTTPLLFAQNVTVCGPNEVTDIPFTISGGFPPYHISITGYPPVTTYDNTGVLPDIPLGEYTMIVNDTCGISSSWSVSVLDSCIVCDTIRASFVVSNPNACAGDTVILTSTSTPGLTPNWTINNVPAGNSLSITVVVDSTIQQEVKLIVQQFTCTDTATTIIRPSVPQSFDLGPDTVFCEIFRYKLTTGLAATVWSTGDTGPSIDINTPGQYIATITGQCNTFADTVDITLKECVSDVDVPDAFTPNGDGTNDFFTVFGTNIVEYEIRIYNRWGELVYHSSDAGELSDLNRGWDGTHRGNLQSLGVFVYYVNAKGVDDTPFFKKGNLTLIR
jgi:gliding motility-associated-like protein